MQRLLKGGASLLRYNYLVNHKKPVVEIPTTVPPKYIYEIKYHPTSQPDFDMKFQDHKHFDDWANIFYGEEDKYQFQYSGQWWNAIGASGKIAIFVTMVWMFVTLHDSAEERKRKHLPGLISYYAVGDIPISHIPTHSES